MTNELDIRQQFLALSSLDDIADLLTITTSCLRYSIYVTPVGSRYSQFPITKKSGDLRIINSPKEPLKTIQKRLNEVLQYVYKPKPSVHGFVANRSILTNASLHASRQYVFNVDLKDFFPSINFGRVRGMFMSKPYDLAPSAATILAQICCHDNQLPQGAPTSPIIANMLCGRMDSELQELARAYKCYYSRYADDITFSTRLRAFPLEIATLNNIDQLIIGHTLARIIATNGFAVNERKVHLHHRSHRQEVTGLTANVKPNINSKLKRQIRGMLYAWEKHTIEKAREHFFSKYDRKQRAEIGTDQLFKQVLKGKIQFVGMIRGTDDALYKRYCARLAGLDPDLIAFPEIATEIIDDRFSRHRRGLREMKRLLGPSHPAYADALNFEARLLDIIDDVLLHGEAPETIVEKNRIVDGLNRFCHRAGLPFFNDLMSRDDK